MSSSIAEVIKIPERIVRPPTTNKGGKEVGMRDGNQPKSGMDTFTGALFEVHVGPLPAIKFTLHQTLACRACPFIEKALNGRFEEANTKVISLPEDDPEIFSEFVSYIYCDRIFNDADVDWLEYSKLWILADKLGVPGLQNLVIEKLSEKASNNERWLNISPAFLRYIYDRTLPESPLRRIFVNIATRWMQPSHARKEENSFLESFSGACAPRPWNVSTKSLITQG
ncbi:hypothetical protein H2199_001919 [Coniosporium tulheliwenetii]|uniref:Uncharacterized protein n=1 Tax=Coniosporium tulheliwenetii TaxID=3383036 RepID=A0ACC2ZKR0_9PEZI|nr:hypothetical protein H2199_001919 [Cladosporium sp. JES 115]